MAKATARIFDEYLAASARAGDRSAFGLLAERWQPKLLAHAYRLLGEREAAAQAAAAAAQVESNDRLAKLTAATTAPPCVGGLL